MSYYCYHKAKIKHHKYEYKGNQETKTIKGKPQIHMIKRAPIVKDQADER